MKRMLTSLVMLLAMSGVSNVLGQVVQPLKERLTFQGPKDGVGIAAISPDGKYIALAGKDLLNLHDADSGKVVGSYQASALSLAFSADGSRLALCNQDEWCSIVEVPSLKPLAAVGAHALGQPRKGARGPMALTAEGQVLIAHVDTGKTTKDGEAYRWAEVRMLDVAAGKSRMLLHGESPEALPGIGVNFAPLAFSPDGSHLAVGSVGAGANFTVTVVEVATGKNTGIKLDTLPLSSGAVLALSLDRKTLAVAQRFQTAPILNGKPALPAAFQAIHYHDLTTGTLKARCDSTGQVIAMATDMQTVVVAADPEPTVKVLRSGALGLACRVVGMKAAVADVEKGALKLKTVPPPASPWHSDYLNLLKKECGIDTVHVDSKVTSHVCEWAEIQGYDAVMRAEIELRFGQDILGRLNRQAEQEYFKAKGK